MNIPELIKKGDARVGLGGYLEPPNVDCRVWAESSFQQVIDVLKQVRRHDIEHNLLGDGEPLPELVRYKIQRLIEES